MRGSPAPDDLSRPVGKSPPPPPPPPISVIASTTREPFFTPGSRGSARRACLGLRRRKRAEPATAGSAAARGRRAVFRRLATGLAVTAALAAAACQSPNHRPPPMGAPQAEVSANSAPAFVAGVTPTTVPPVAVGTPVGFRLSSSADGWAHLYLIGADGGVTALAENLSLAAGAQAAYPRPGDGVTLRASPPAGIDRLILLVTRQPFVGFAGAAGQTLARPVALATTADDFLEQFNAATDALPEPSWAVAETRVQVME